MQTLTAGRLVIAGVELRSRLFVGTGKYADDETMLAALEASGCELVTVALRRLDLDDPKKKTILDVVDWKRFRPRTANPGADSDQHRAGECARRRRRRHRLAVRRGAGHGDRSRRRAGQQRDRARAGSAADG